MPALEFKKLDDQIVTTNGLCAQRTRERVTRMIDAVSVWATKYHDYQAQILDNLDTDLNGLAEAWRWAGNVTGSYSLSYGVQFGVAIQRPAAGASNSTWICSTCFNTSASTSAVFQAGPSFGYTTDLVPPRLVRLGVRYCF